MSVNIVSMNVISNDLKGREEFSSDIVRILNYIDLIGVIYDLDNLSQESLMLLGVEPIRFCKIFNECKNLSYIEETEDGLQLTAEGIKVIESIRKREVKEHKENIWDIYEQFKKVNNTFKETITDWQMIKKESGELEINDHSDSEHDKNILQRIYNVDSIIQKFFIDLIKVIPRYEIYLNRFSRAMENIKSGKIHYIAKFSVDSYHTIWFQLHEDLIKLLGDKREE